MAAEEPVTVIIPIGGRAKGNFEKTVVKQWTLDKLLNELGTDVNVILPDNIANILKQAERFAIWGATPRVRGVEGFFAALSSAGGGVAVFLREGNIVCWGRIFAWIQSKDLAGKLWGFDEERQTWEYVYFIRDLRCCNPGIPWDVVREKLGYGERFIPFGHTFVKSDRLRGIINEYGDVIKFLGHLATKVCDAGEEVDLLYNPYLIQSLKRLKPLELLEVIGRISVELVNVRMAGGLSKHKVAERVGEALANAGLKDHINYIATEENPLLLNDLRRLGIIIAGNPVREWDREAEVRVAPLAYRVAHTVEFCRRMCTDQDARICFQVGGVIAITSILTNIVSEGSPELKEVLRDIMGGSSVDSIAEKLASKHRISDVERLKEVLAKMKELVENVLGTLGDVRIRACIPQLYVPLGITSSRIGENVGEHLGSTGGTAGG